jgi:hypothetical protein
MIYCMHKPPAFLSFIRQAAGCVRIASGIQPVPAIRLWYPESMMTLMCLPLRVSAGILNTVRFARHLEGTP